MKRGIGSVTLSISLPAELAVEIYNEADRQGKDGLLFRPNTSFTHALYRACDCITVTHRAREVAEPGHALRGLCHGDHRVSAATSIRPSRFLVTSISLSR
jgi:hypothetical protein